MINMADNPIEDTRALYKLSMEKANPKANMMIAVKSTDGNVKFVMIDTTDIMMMQNIIPFARWCTGPALSVILTQSAPIEMAIPTGSKSKKPNKNAGRTMPQVILIPSLKNRPFMKFIYSLVLIIYLWSPSGKIKCLLIRR